jgi:hypothetical protein
VVVTTLADLEVGFARLAALIGPCAHPATVPVETVLTGELVAWLCPGCDSQLPAAFLPRLPAPPE